MTVRQLAEKILSLTGSSSSLEFKALPEDDPKQRRPDISLAQEKLGWNPRFDLEEGLTRTIQYFESQLSKGFVLEHGPQLKVVNDPLNNVA